MPDLLCRCYTAAEPLLYCCCSAAALQDIESLLKQWAGTFQIPDADLMQRLTEATSGDLQRPPDRCVIIPHFKYVTWKMTGCPLLVGFCAICILLGCCCFGMSGRPRFAAIALLQPVGWLRPSALALTYTLAGVGA